MILLLVQIKLYNIHIKTEELDIESVPLQKLKMKRIWLIQQQNFSSFHFLFR